MNIGTLAASNDDDFVIQHPRQMAYIKKPFDKPQQKLTLTYLLTKKSSFYKVKNLNPCLRIATESWKIGGEW